MTELYRFRSVRALLCEKFAELDRQTIFFAAPDELNDPMEGFRDIIWAGDHILWINLFRDYVNCLHWSFHHMLVFGEHIRFEPRDVRAAPPWNAPPTAGAQELSQTIWAKVKAQAQLTQFAENITAFQRKARKAELASYLRLIHVHALTAIRQTYIAKGFIAEDDWSDTAKLFPSPMALTDMLDYATQAGGEQVFDAVFSMIDHLSAKNTLIYRYNNRHDNGNIAHLNKMSVFFNFPSLYIEQLGALLWPQWYTACFAKTFNNSSMWSHYGDKHEGACLIFDTEDTEDSATIALTHIVNSPPDQGRTTETARDFVPMPFYKMQYQQRPEEVNFFHSMGHLPLGLLMNLWFTDEGGTVSNLYRAYTGDEIAWRERYWEAFRSDIAFKTKDWEYEQELRLVLYSALGDFANPNDRTLTYDFGSLTGIIFGMRMSDQHKQEIIEIVERKCREANRTDFEFYQAYYDPRSGEIQSRPLHIQFAGLG